MDDLPTGEAHGDPGQARETLAYRSYVVRIWSRPSSGADTVRAQIEEVQSGRLVELRGDAAAEVCARITAAVSTPDRGTPAPGRRHGVGCLIDGSAGRKGP